MSITVPERPPPRPSALGWRQPISRASHTRQVAESILDHTLPTGHCQHQAAIRAIGVSVGSVLNEAQMMSFRPRQNPTSRGWLSVRPHVLPRIARTPYRIPVARRALIRIRIVTVARPTWLATPRKDTTGSLQRILAACRPRRHAFNTDPRRQASPHLNPSHSPVRILSVN